MYENEHSEQCTFVNNKKWRYFQGSCQIHLWRQIAGGGIKGGKALPQRSFSSFPIILDLFAAISQHTQRKARRGIHRERESEGNLAARRVIDLRLPHPKERRDGLDSCNARWVQWTRSSSEVQYGTEHR